MIEPDNHLNRIQKFILLIIAGAGIFLRVLDGIHFPIFMDELPILYNIAHFINNRTLDPSHFNYPTLFSYLAVLPTGIVFIGNMLIQGYPLSGLSNGQWMKFLFEQHRDVLIYGGRFVSILAFTAILWALYKWGKKAFGFIPLLIAFLMLVFDPFGGVFFAYTRYSLPDVTSAFWVTLGMMLCFQYLISRNKKALWAASLIIGLGISTKYNAGMAIIPLGLTFIIDPPKKWRTTLLGMIGLGLIGVILGSPAMTWVPQKFWDGFLYESKHMAEGHLGGHDIDYWWVIRYIWGQKTLMLPFIGLALLIACIRHEKKDLIFLAILVPSFLVIGQFEKKAIHYFIFLYPILALFIGRSIKVVWSFLNRRWMRILFIAITLILFTIYPGYRIIKMVKRDRMTDNRVLAEAWIELNVPSGKGLLYDPLMLTHLNASEKQDSVIHAFQTAGNPFTVHVEKFFKNKPAYRTINIQNVWDFPDTLSDLSFDYAIISSWNYDRFFEKNTNRLPPAGSPNYKALNFRKDFYNKIINEVFRDHLVQAFQGLAGPRIYIYKK